MTDSKIIKTPYHKKILIVDDDKSLLNMIKVIANKEGYYNVYTVSSGYEAIEVAKRIKLDLIILDIMLPDIDGYEVCRNIRLESMVPIIFLSAKSDEIDKLLSYAMGGDEYIEKTFSPRELLAKIKAVLIRQQYYENKMNKDNTYMFGKYILDMNKRMLLCENKEVLLTAKEYLLLEYLVVNRGITISKERILEKIWDVDYDGYDNTIMVHIRHLREKIEEEPSNPIYIKTVKGRGYMFNDDIQREYKI